VAPALPPRAEAEREGRAPGRAAALGGSRRGGRGGGGGALIERLRAQAISHSLFLPLPLGRALHRLGFVQADPIRAPARAQDLILRHRVSGYRAGELERRYPTLAIEEDVLYAYGFLSRPLWQLLHPRTTAPLSRLERQVLATVTGLGPTHPRALEAHHGSARVVNAWGGQSKATTHALERLHRRGLLRVARRDNGIRIYEPAPRPAEPLAPPERLRRLCLAVADILAPVSRRTLLAIAARLRRWTADFPAAQAVLRELLGCGALEQVTAGGESYLWPAARRPLAPVPRVVRLLAPFDPVVWDRRRFEQLWGWPYRFEAYTPLPRRVRGYYALPLLWGEAMVGWANATMAGGKLQVALGFVARRPSGADFTRELEAEVARMEAFLGSGQMAVGQFP
jgi:uncharacterized protein YcaQ